MLLNGIIIQLSCPRPPLSRFRNSQGTEQMKGDEKTNRKSDFISELHPRCQRYDLKP